MIEKCISLAKRSFFSSTLYFRTCFLSFTTVFLSVFFPFHFLLISVSLLCFSASLSCGIPEDSESPLFLLFLFCDGGMSLQWNAASLARGVTVDGQSEATGGRREERRKRKNDRTMCLFAVFLHHSTFHSQYEL